MLFTAATFRLFAILIDSIEEGNTSIENKLRAHLEHAFHTHATPNVRDSESRVQNSLPMEIRGISISKNEKFKEKVSRTRAEALGACCPIR